MVVALCGGDRTGKRVWQRRRQSEGRGGARGVRGRGFTGWEEGAGGALGGVLARVGRAGKKVLVGRREGAAAGVQMSH